MYGLTRYYFLSIVAGICFIFIGNAHADIICSDSSSNASSGTLYDSGGSGGRYSNYEDCGFLIQPSGASTITLSFSDFEYENGYDELRIYDGANSSGTLLATYTGSSLPASVTATSGAMYIVHESDYSVTRDGFIATWSVDSSSSPVAQWHFDEDSWDGSSGEIIDIQGNLSGFAVNGANTIEGGHICGAASFDGVDDYLDVTGIDNYLNTTSSLSFWVKTTQTGDNTSWRAEGITGVEEAGGGDDIFWGWLDASGRIGITKGNGNKAQSSSAINDGNWQHIVFTRDTSSGQLKVYVNGSLNATVNGTTGDVGRSFSSFGRIEDTGGSLEYFQGQLDEVLIFDHVISASQVQSIYDNQVAGNDWDGSTRSCSLEPLVELRFEEESWDGTEDEVIDSSGNDHHGRLLYNASPASDNPAISPSGGEGTCDYASFSSGSIALEGLPVASSSDAKTTVAFWMYWDGTDSSMPIGWSYYDLWFRSGSFGFNTWRNDIYGISSASLSNGWHHIVAEFNNSSSKITSNKLWVDGVEQSLSQRRGSPSSSRSIGSELRVGGAVNSSYYRFHGRIDELRIYQHALSNTQVSEVMNDTHPCGGNSEPDYFSISHDNSATYCLSESISVTAHNSDSSTFTSYNGTIVLDTQSSKGTWSLVTGNGSLVDSTADDGLATYTFNESDNGIASFALYYDNGVSTINIDAYENDIRDNDAEGDIFFSATGFSVTANTLSNPPVTPINDPVLTQQSGSSFSIAIAAYGINPNNGVCGIIETYAGNKSIALSNQYHNPVSGTLSVQGSGTVNFVNGQATVNTQYNDVGEISITVTDSAASMSGQSNHFVVQPTDFSISITDNPQTTDAGNGFIASGENFTVEVQALNNQGDVTPNFGNETTPESVTVTLASLVFPIGGDVGALSNGSNFTKTGSLFQNASLSWNNVGSITLAASVADADYLGTGNITSSPSGTVGRFYPDSFFISSESVVNACSNFTYLSQPDLTVAYTLSAIDGEGNTLSNYDSGLGYPIGTVQHFAELANNGSDLGSRLSVASATWSGGDYVVSDNSAVFARGSNREAPLTGLVLSTNVDDIDDRPVNNANVNASTNDDCSVAGNCNAVEIGSANFYYGRLTLPDAYGPETANLPALFLTEYWNGQQFVQNVYDNCTLIPRSIVAFNSNPITSTADLSVNLLGGTSTAQFAALTASHIGFSSGDASLSFSAPGTAITVDSFVMDVDLTSIDWLRFDWNQDGNDNNDTALPTATIRFKAYRGHDRILYWRHKY